MRILLVLFLITHLTLATGLGQNGPAIVKADPSACELNSLFFDMISNILAKDPTAKITAKFYAGKTESNATSEKRAKYVQQFLERRKRFDHSRLEFINSGKLDTDENPKIEFYVVRPNETDGYLYLVSYAQLNKTPCLDCCEDRSDFPQYIGPKTKKKMTKPRKTGTALATAAIGMSRF